MSLNFETSRLQGVILFGQAQDQAGLLVEPSSGREIDVENHTDVAAFRNLIWLIQIYSYTIQTNCLYDRPLVEEANKISPAFSRIFKEMILITAPNKPLPRVGKGSVARKEALALYETEIKNLSVNFLPLSISS